ncbi:DMT family transporter [Sneathiella sp. CAU 1612]|uniref:DMT family transporter n=1 Tax=Sneathiella sedimenti TaxID=2816034 RepID=A0ABS3F2A6_9PROT|nr:DMT family transporter [Sneathiella sedimenti]MBO0332639.1 DMT family transporter [Sneathiella sedimenti]
MPPTEPMANQASNMRAYLLLTLTTTCWGMNAVLGRLAVGEISPMMLVCMRWLLVVLILSLVSYRHLRNDWAVIKKYIGYMLAMGAFGFTGFNMLFYLAAHSTTAVNIGILQGSIPVFVLIGAFLVFRTRVSLLQSVGVSVTIIGVGIVASGGSFARLATFEINQGDALMLLACVLYSGYTVALRYRPEISALSFLTVMATSAFLTSIPFVWIEMGLDHFLAPTFEGWIIVAVASFFPSIIAQISFIAGVRILGPGRAGIFVNLVPIFASIFAVTFLNEPFELFHGAALALVLFGIWLSEKGKPA